MHHCWFSGRFEQILLKINLPHSRKLGPRILLVLFSKSHLQCFPSSFPPGLTQCCWGIFIQDNKFPPQFTVRGVKKEGECNPNATLGERKAAKEDLGYFSKKSQESCFYPHPFQCFVVKPKEGKSWAGPPQTTKIREYRQEKNSINGLRDLQCHTNFIWATLFSTGIYLVRNQLTKKVILFCIYLKGDTEVRMKPCDSITHTQLWKYVGPCSL